ncbi:hypothetical protein [Bacillus sp. AK128]
MLGFMLNKIEQKELEYLLKREMDEILHDFQDHRIDHIVKRAMEERYQILFKLFRRIATPYDCSKYIRSKQIKQYE